MAAEEETLSVDERLRQWERLGPRFRLQIKRLSGFVPVGSVQMREIQAVLAHCDRLLAQADAHVKWGS